jgi:hypothetical protein
MKVYFGVGLKDPARASWFRAETLTSLDSISMHFSCMCGIRFIDACFASYETSKMP